jgi:ADP-ribose pyrophosphatase YjhB (NUDIX family)
MDKVLRVSAYGVIVDDGRILLCRIDEPDTVGHGSWTLPGGGLEFGEGPRDGAVREIREETGYEAELHEVLDIDSFVGPCDGKMQHAVRIIYRATAIGGQLRNEIGGTTDIAQWHDLASCSDLSCVPLAKLGIELAVQSRP